MRRKGYNIKKPQPYLIETSNQNGDNWQSKNSEAEFTRLLKLADEIKEVTKEKRI